MVVREGKYFLKYYSVKSTKVKFLPDYPSIQVWMEGLRRSERQRAPPQSDYANEFVGELWEKIRVGTKEGETQGSSQKQLIDVSDLNPSRKSWDLLLSERNVTVEKETMAMEAISPTTKFDQAMEEAEELDGHALHLSHRLASVQRENMGLHMAVTLLQEKVQRMEAKGIVKEEIQGNTENVDPKAPVNRRMEENDANGVNGTERGWRGREFHYGRGGFR